MTHFRRTFEDYNRFCDEPPDKPNSTQWDGLDPSAKDIGDRLPRVWFKDIQPSLDTLDFVQGVLVERSAAVVYGESNSGKTFWVLDLALHVAAGREWFGRRVEQGGVVYCALEGAARFRNRVAAWRSGQGLDGHDVPFAAVEAPINLLDPTADTERMIWLIRDTARDINVPVKLIIIDTLSRALAGGNENAPDDMGSLVMNMDRIRSETGACVLFIHHSGKDQAKGARGHSLLRAAVDTEIEIIDNAGARSATVGKQRELDKGDVFSFRLKVIELGCNRYGEPVTTCVIEPATVGEAPVQRRTRLSGNNQVAADLLRRAMDRYGKPLPSASDYPPNTLGVTEDQWRQTFYKGFPGENQDTKRKTFNRAKRDLLASRIICSNSDLIWFVHRADE